MKTLITESANADRQGIWTYYAEELDNAPLADRIDSDLLDGIQKISATPGIGHRRRNLCNREVRIWRVHQFLLIYSIAEESICVLRILHGARDVAELLKDDENKSLASHGGVKKRLA